MQIIFVLNRFDENIYSFEYVCSYIVCENLMVNVDQHHNLQRKTQNKTDSLSITVTFWCICVTVVDVNSNTLYCTCSECVPMNLFKQHAKRIRCIILCCVLCLALPCFSTLSHKRNDFQKRRYELNTFFILSTNSLGYAFFSMKNSVKY